RAPPAPTPRAGSPHGTGNATPYGESRLRYRAGALDRSPAKAQSAAAGDHWTSGARIGSDPGGHRAAARPSEAQLHRIATECPSTQGMNDILAAGARALGIDLDRDAPSRLMAYLSLLRKWNRTHNLTAIVEPEKMITRHLLDSLSVVPHLPVKPKLRVADVGSGGGLPGIPLAICRPDWRLTLIDSNQK